MLEYYKDFFIKEDLKELHPAIYKVLGRYSVKIYQILNIASDSLQIVTKTNRFLFFQSTATLAKKISTSQRTAANIINLMALVGIIRKLNDNELPGELGKELRTSRDKKKYRYCDDVYEFIPKEDFVDDLEAFCRYLIDSGFTVRGPTYEGLLRNYGKDVATRVFVQENPNKKISELSNEVVSKITNTLLFFLEEKGWTTEAEVLENVKYYFKGQKGYKKLNLKNVLMS